MPQQVARRAHAIALGALAAITLMVVPASAAQRPVPSHEPSAARTTASARHEVARVNATSILSDRLDAAVAALIPMESFHRNVSAEKRAELTRRALDALIDDELQFQEGQRLAIHVPPQDVETAWRETVTRNGGERAFAELLRRNATTRRQVRQELVRLLTIGRTLEREVTRSCAVTSEDAARFYEANPERFVEPEQLHIQAITVGVDPSSGAGPWQQARERAAEALRQLRAGVAFERVVTEYSTDQTRARGGDLGFLHRGSLTEPFEAAVGTLEVGQPSDVLETLYGYHIIRVIEVRPPQRKSLAEVRTTLERDLTATRCDERKRTWIAGLRARARVTVVEKP